jgi:hypothetical protein
LARLVNRGTNRGQHGFSLGVAAFFGHRRIDLFPFLFRNPSVDQKKLIE